MNLANPLALAFAALAVPIVIFYILKIRLRRVPVSTVLFWQQIFDEKQPRSLWQRLRHLISLLVQLALLALLVLALADPFFFWESLQARRLVLVIDNSASMRAVENGESRLARAKAEARRAIASLRLRDEMAIVAAGTQPKVVCGMTGHQRTLREALDRVPEADGPTKVNESVALARQLLAGEKKSQVIVLSDGGFEGADKLAQAADVRWIGVGGATSNVAIARFQVRRSLLDPLGYEILAEVVNQSDSPAECRLDIDLAGEPIDVVPLKLAAGQAWSQSFEKTSIEGGRLVARLDKSDALSSDNAAWAILPPRRRHRVLLVTEGNLFLQKVFEANPLVDLTVAAEPPAEPPPGTVVIYHRVAPNPVPQGNVVFVQPSAATDLWELGEATRDTVVTKQDKDSPLMANVDLTNVLIPEAPQVTLQETPTILAEAVTGNPLYVAWERPQGKVLALTVDLDQSDLPLRTAFPILMTNALSWFAGTKDELRESLATGDVVVVKGERTGDGAAEGRLLETPSGIRRPLPQGIEEVTVGPLDQVGVWRVVRGTRPRTQADETPTWTAVQEFACNLANARESDLRVSESLARSTGSTASGWGGRPVWFYLIGLAWLLAGSEWYLYQRRWIS